MKIKKRQQILSWLLAVSVIAMYLFLPPVKPAGAVSSIYNAKDLITDSDFGVTNVTHTFTFTTSTTTKQDDYFRFTFPAGFANVGGGTETCMWGDADFTASSTASARMVDCTYDAATNIAPASSTQVVITGVINPLTENVQGYSIYVRHYGSNGLLKEQVKLKVYIISSVVMTAHVNAILTFTISGMDTSDTVNNIPCGAQTWATSTDFGTLSPTSSSTVCQQLQVATNASEGYTVTVEQDNELESSAGDNINSFRNAIDGSASTTAQAWVTPTSVLDQDWTYGHMGLTSDDDDLSGFSTGYNDFYQGGQAYFVGLNNTESMPIMHHDGPTTNTTQNTGLAHVLYKAQIGVLQQAGDYQNQLTYIATAIY